MKLSVIIPAYNSETFLAETLDCLDRQLLNDIQIIVVDDNSDADKKPIECGRLEVEYIYIEKKFDKKNLR